MESKRERVVPLENMVDELLNNKPNKPWSLLSRILHSTQKNNSVNRYCQWEVVNIVVKVHRIEGRVNSIWRVGLWLRKFPEEDDA